MNPATRRPSGLTPAALGFLAGKGSAFAAPVVLAVAMNPMEYGAFEEGWARGQVLASILGMGMAGALPFFIVERGRIGLRRFFRTHRSLLLLVSVIAGVVVVFGAGDTHLAGAATVLGSLIAVQLLSGAEAKALGESTRAALVESGWQMAALVLAVTTMVLGWGSLTTTGVVGLLGAFSALWLVASVRAKVAFRPRLLLRLYGEVLPYSSRALLASAVMVPLVTFSRLVIGRLVGVEELALYASGFRLLSGGIIVHQFAVVFLFRRLYTADRSRFDRLGASILGLTFATSATVALAVLFIPLPGLDLVSEIRVGERQLPWLLACQMVAWSGLALVEMQMIRADRALALAAMCTAGLIAAFMVVGLGTALFGASVTLVVAGNIVGMSVASLGALSRLRNRLGRPAWFSTILILSAVGALVIQGASSGS